VSLFLKNVVFTVFVPGTVGGYLPYAIGSRAAVGGGGGPLDAGRLLVAAPLFLVGAAIYFWCLWHFAVTGRGTPAPIDPPTRLVVRGLYRRVRNPMYVGVLLVVAGWALYYRSIRVIEYAVALAVLFHVFVVFVEEPLLRRRFGAAYDDYTRTVGRWVPR
jgi:protein-S-isoprenylcysteine O-methyltransferase Ste14